MYYSLLVEILQVDFFIIWEITRSLLRANYLARPIDPIPIRVIGTTTPCAQ